MFAPLSSRTAEIWSEDLQTIGVVNSVGRNQCASQHPINENLCSLLNSLLSICVTPTEKIHIILYVCLYVLISYFSELLFHVGSRWSPVKLSHAFIMGPRTCTCYYITVAPLLFSPSSLLSCFLSSFFSILLSLWPFLPPALSSHIFLPDSKLPST